SGSAATSPGSAPTSTGAGILRPELLTSYTTLARHACHPDLGRHVENYWSLRWDLPRGTSFESQTLPHPACTLSVERGHTRAGIGHDPVVLTGVVTRRFDVTVAGRGWVCAAKFRPGGLAALTGRGVGPLRDRVVSAAPVLPRGVVAALEDLDASVSLDDCIRVMDEALLDLGSREDPRYDLVLAIIADMLDDRTLVRVAQLEERHGTTVRTIQRLFDHYVGVGPKWVLARYRMHDAVSDLDAGYDGRLADLAVSLGWYDEAHFIRDFVALVGQTPGQYRARRASRAAADDAADGAADEAGTLGS
ncbi:AraC family transcriptional regulator, partial [Intrasporangium sp.]|uniref:AraC family transcriptional regulator n=1 Tax=Intrasporangium sp. TaxID=1925024 RepID=UPI002939FFED